MAFVGPSDGDGLTGMKGSVRWGDGCTSEKNEESAIKRKIV